ncbi:hypothetical protein [Burkholderia ubonensis]|uniref:hypothetical protein n=1 Tax=Burkholderia ubonensis TaxID=101571 RepID=UPI0012F94D66|nr:hypothetical protein [Burkholderia ubonensis]
MEIDQLKLIIQALTGLADGAKEGFIWWLVIEGALPKLLMTLFGAAFLATGIYIAKLIARHASSSNQSEIGIRQISKIVGQELYGGWISPSEVNRVVSAVEKAVRNKGA